MDRWFNGSWGRQGFEWRGEGEGGRGGTWGLGGRREGMVPRERETETEWPSCSGSRDTREGDGFPLMLGAVFVCEWMSHTSGDDCNMNA